MKEYINILDVNGKNKKAQVIIRYYNDETKLYYIVYKIDNSYYAAKYDDVIGTSKLDTNLSNEEIEKLEKLLNNMEENI